MAFTRNRKAFWKLHFFDQKKKQQKNVDKAENSARRFDPVWLANEAACARTGDQNVEDSSCDEEKQMEW